MKITARLRLILSGIWKWLAPTVNDFASKAGKTLLESASQAVIETAKFALDKNDEKRKMAYGLIVADLKTKGIQLGVDVTTSLINRALELAVSKEKAEGNI